MFLFFVVKGLMRNEQIRECVSCDWIGWATDCVHPKHIESVSLCPECNDATDWVSPDQCREWRDQLEVLREAAQDFVEKVERGEARSKRSYAKFKSALALLTGESE